MDNQAELKLITELENRIRELKTENEILKSKIVDKNEDIDYLTRQCNEKDKSLVDLMINNNNLRVENKRLQAMLEFVKEKLENFLGGKNGRN
ncbi:TPA: hypothetical protein U3L52_001934 [Streptococcus agalactiae]|uniref:hypothetical protein n=1 Tax=Streptococcus agalactiae TaxID=1311 RepID=UPI0002FB6FFC|nr:hypothetical protein [Streptococcus agalactiae]ALB16199.1 hypothetical protein AMD29_06370 [Streptococcus agalactiae]AMQ13721.1 hypothetical protein CUGBS08_00124 [Streptococcus agalactiae]ASA81989.1 hypothetical protein BB197_06465 [Streptococcus agalactiae]ASA84042.1 hypothetical protein BB194_06465 [Streptococcus agalactiae]ASA86092.1 hypothetical protein BB313_06460 [Streptococcus agalactiae]